LEVPAWLRCKPISDFLCMIPVLANTLSLPGRSQAGSRSFSAWLVIYFKI
jgi:hypothetical protein